MARLKLFEDTDSLICHMIKTDNFSLTLTIKFGLPSSDWMPSTTLQRRGCQRIKPDYYL